MTLDPPLGRRPAWLVLAVAWLTLPLSAGAAIPALLRSASATPPGRAAAWGLAASAFGAGTVGLLRLTGRLLAVVRAAAMALLSWVGVPAALTLDPVPGGAVLALGLLIAGLAWSPPVAQASAEASAVPWEKRFALAAPPGLAVLLGPLAAAAASGGIVGPLLLASGTFARARAVPALALAVPGAAAALLLGPATLRLARRWLVLVPSGVVIHDPVLLNDTYRISPSELGALALTAPGWRARLRSPDVLDATGGAPRAVWLGLTGALAAPGTRPGVRRPGGPIRHIFCAPVQRGEAAAALEARGYRVVSPVGAP